MVIVVMVGYIITLLSGLGMGYTVATVYIGTVARRDT